MGVDGVRMSAAMPERWDHGWGGGGMSTVIPGRIMDVGGWGGGGVQSNARKVGSWMGLARGWGWGTETCRREKKQQSEEK